MSAIKTELHREVDKMRVHWKAFAIGFLFLFVIPQLYWEADGRYFNRVIVFTYGVDPLAFEVSQAEYCPGDSVKIYTSFCKTREVLSANTDWWIANGELIPVQENQENKNPASLLATGCFGKDKPVLLRIHDIPLDLSEGYHYSVGATTHVLTNGEVRHLDLLTKPYYVKSEAECKPEKLEPFNAVQLPTARVDFLK